AIGMNLDPVDLRTLPAGNAVDEHTFAGVLRILEQLLVPGEIEDRLQARGHRLDASLGIALDHVPGYVPALGGSLVGIPEIEDLPLGRDLGVPVYDVGPPELHLHVDLAGRESL